MRRILLPVLLAVMAAPAPAEDADFRFVARRIESEYHAERLHIPLFGLARFVSRPFGVGGLELAIWEDLSYGRMEGGARLQDLVSGATSRGWKPMVRVHSPRKHEVVQIFAKPEGTRMRLLVIAVDDDTVMVHVKVNPDRLSWLLTEPRLRAAHVAR